MEIIKVDSVSKSFNGKKILKEVDLVVKEGEIIGIIGPSASGKSVFIKILIGFLRPNSGNIEVNIGSKNPFGFSMQNNSLYDYLTVKQNLVYFSELYDLTKEEGNKRISLLLKKLKLKEFENILVKNTSGGTKKRVDIACAILKNPKILVLDEPFLGLDPSLINLISKFILDLRKSGLTILISSHRINELSKICSRMVLIKNKTLYSIKKSQIGQAYI